MRTPLLPGLIVAVALSLGVGLSTVAGWLSVRENERVAQARFDFKIDEVRFAVTQRILAYEHVLRGAVSLFAAKRNEVTRHDWQVYVRQLRIDQH